jgi:uncharacterized membrane protein
VEDILAAVQQSGYGALVRQSVFLYPLANVLHVLAVLVFFASVAVMDMRLLGVLKGMPVEAVIAHLRPLAIGALVIVVVTGITLFVPEAGAIARNPAFQVKLAAIALGFVNVLVNARTLRQAGEGAVLVRATAGASLVLWLAVAACGRLIAYL